MRLQITAGRGPREVQSFVAELADQLESLVHEGGGTVERLATTSGSVRLRVEGVQLAHWLGTHELVDPTRGRGRRRRWFCAVSQLPEEVARSGLDERDVQIRACRSGGPGGQHVNTTSSAVRAVHLPTGLAVRVASERSQHRNRAEAVRALSRMLQERGSAQTAENQQIAQSQHNQVVRGAPVQRWIRTRGSLMQAR